MALQYTHRPLNGQWPGPRSSVGLRSPFGANWGGTLELLEREIKALGGRNVVLALNVSERDIRNDGGVRADARIRDHAVIIEFKRGPDLLSFPCDRFRFWQDNVRAIALALEALRKVDRYGVRTGRQYEGFKALPGAGASSATMHVSEAAEIIADLSGEAIEGADLLTDRWRARDAVRSAASRTHPDRFIGDPQAFQRVQEAKRILEAHHGGAL